VGLRLIVVIQPDKYCRTRLNGWNIDVKGKLFGAGSSTLGVGGGFDPY